MDMAQGSWDSQYGTGHDRAGECDGRQSAGGDAAMDGQWTPSMRVREGQQKFLRQSFPERQPNLLFWGT